MLCLLGIAWLSCLTLPPLAPALKPEQMLFFEPDWPHRQPGSASSTEPGASSCRLFFFVNPPHSQAGVQGLDPAEQDHPSINAFSESSSSRAGVEGLGPAQQHPPPVADSGPPGAGAEGLDSDYNVKEQHTISSLVMARWGALSEAFLMLIVTNILSLGLATPEFMRDGGAAFCKDHFRERLKAIKEWWAVSCEKEVKGGRVKIYTAATQEEFLKAATTFRAWLASPSTSAMSFDYKGHCLAWAKAVHVLLQLKGSVADVKEFPEHELAFRFTPYPWFGPVRMSLAQAVVMLIQDLVSELLA